jgi:hypothetical protein
MVVNVSFYIYIYPIDAPPKGTWGGWSKPTETWIVEDLTVDLLTG